MAASPNVQNSFGPELAAYEYMPHPAPQTREPDCPLYFVADYKREAPPVSPEQEPEAKELKRKILGLSVPVFWVVLVITILLVLGTSRPVTSGTVGLADNSCTSSTPRTYTATDNSHFTQFCFTDWPNGGAAADGRGEVEDLRRLTLYTFEDCMEACVSYNEDLEDDETGCMAVTYNSNLTSIVAVGKQGGNCFLKNKRGEDHTGSAESACAAIAR